MGRCVIARPGRDRRVQDRQLRLRVARQLGHRSDRGIEPLLRVGRNLRLGLERRGDERLQGVVLAGDRVGAGDQSVARQRNHLVDGHDRRLRSRQIEHHRLVVDEPGRRVDRTLGKRGSLAVVGVCLNVDVGRGEAGRAKQCLEHDPAAAVLARRAELATL